MSDINAVHTQHVKTTQAAQAAASQNKSNGVSGRGQGVNFFDLLFTKVTNAQDTSEAVAFDLSGDATTMPLDAEGLKRLQAKLDSLLQGLPAGQRPVALKLTAANLQKILQAPKADAEDAQQSLIATGLSPEQLAQLGELLQQGDESDTGLKALLIGILKLVPDEDRNQTIFLPKTLLVAREEKGQEDDRDDELSASLNALCVDCPPAATVTPTGDENLASADGVSKKGAGGFNEVLKLLEQIQSKAAGETTSFDKFIAGRAAENAAPGPLNSTIGASFDAILGSFSAGGSLEGFFPEGLDWSQGNTYGLSNTQAGGPAQLTSLVTQAPAASQPHPATQIVIATLTRTAQGGEDKKLTLRLDPPDLGKIQIQMHFTRDKSVKTHMVFEKPETMLMMQRDSTLLQQSLQDAGMDAGGNSLSFELAGQDTFSGGNDGRNGGQGNASSDAAEPQIIETTMSWSVDEATGIYHYNLLV